MGATRLAPFTVKDAYNKTKVTSFQYWGDGKPAKEWACMWEPISDTETRVCAVHLHDMVRAAMRYTEQSWESLTIGSAGYTALSIPSEVVAAIDAGAILLRPVIAYWGSNTGAFDVALYPNKDAYIYGTPGVKVTNLKVRWMYV